MPKPARAASTESPESGGRLAEDSPASVAAMVAALEEDIVLGRLHPRERLIEEELILRFRASRHAIRQALAELDRMGIVARIPNRGALVRSYTRAEVEQLYALRELLETEAARLIPLPPPAQALAELKAVQTRHDAAVAAEDMAAIFRANLAFHRGLFGLCGNAFLADAIEAAAQRAHGIRFLALGGAEEREKARREHHAIIEAIGRRDRDGLIRLCRDHLPASKAAYLRAFGHR
ncbi:GntR family transcriptional regulator [Roseomonas marmotae]|uniref:GntR family transcriptional regulator n=1 Tax=Roseomonas marmotae TaxID=2768161 RepID=A0ABS3KF81_9PROT|nr:GntR family transcriptional regulator [Roseomonas marmotae]MBO1075006.1 GntR family transcriptional regulator [Roseomonas marmotae]QTI79958.1 GntR family transcriptional regulator [Roseomonas marmotae]